MEEEEKMFERAFDRLLGIGVSIVIALLLCLLLSSCGTTKYVPVETIRTDTIYKAKEIHDSIHVRDSIYVNKWTAGDTVYLERTKWRTQYVEHLKTDTIHEWRIDSVQIPYPVPAHFTWWQRVCIDYGKIMFGVSVAAVAVAAFVLLRRKE